MKRCNAPAKLARFPVVPGRSANVSSPGCVPVFRIFSYPDKITNSIKECGGGARDQAGTRQLRAPPGLAAGPDGRSRTLPRG